MEDEKTTDIADFFTERNEREGVWFEPTVDGKGCGIELKVLGRASDAAAESGARYDKELAAIEAEGNAARRNELSVEALAERAASLVTDVRRKGGGRLVMDGKEFEPTHENVRRVLRESRVLREGVIAAFVSDATFMTKKA